MRDSKLIIIVLLLFLLVVSGGALFYFYQQNIEIKSAKNQTVQVYIAKTNLEQNRQITEKDLAIITLPKASVPFEVLIKNEIIGKYTLAPILQNEPIRAEKVGKEKTNQELNSTIAIEQAKYDLYNMALKLFQNPNYILKSGDMVDIVGVWGSEEEPTVQYIAKSINLYGFLYKGLLHPTALKKTVKEVQETKDKKPVKKITYDYADEIIFDTREKIITSIITAHNKGKQLWMVLSGAEEEQKVIKKIEKKVKKRRIVKKSTPLKKEKAEASIIYGANEYKESFKQ